MGPDILGGYSPLQPPGAQALSAPLLGHFVHFAFLAFTQRAAVVVALPLPYIYWPLLFYYSVMGCNGVSSSYNRDELAAAATC